MHNVNSMMRDNENMDIFTLAVTTASSMLTVLPDRGDRKAGPWMSAIVMADTAEAVRARERTREYIAIEGEGTEYDLEESQITSLSIIY
jgi:hypothetical protein